MKKTLMNIGIKNQAHIWTQNAQISPGTCYVIDSKLEFLFLTKRVSEVLLFQRFIHSL